MNSPSKEESRSVIHHATFDEAETTLAVKKDIIKTEELLGHGTFQFCILVCVQLSASMLIFHYKSLTLLAPEVDHWCRPPADQARLTLYQWKNMSLPVTDDGTYSKCTMYDPVEMLRSNWTEVQCTQWQFDLRPGVNTIVSEWNLVCERKWTIRVLFVYSMFGGLILLPLQGQLADKFGRLPIACVSILSCVIFGSIAIFAEQIATFAMARMFLSASFSSLKMVLVILLFESLGDRNREAYCCFVEVGSVAGNLAVSVLENYQIDWKVVCMITLTPTVVLIAVFYNLEESVRWLLAVWDIERMEKVTVRVSRYNNTDIDIETVIGRLMRSDKIYCRRSAVDIRDLVTMPLRWRALVLSWIWFSMYLSFYGLNMLTESGAGIGFAVLETLPHLVSIFIAIVLLSDYPRKTALSLALPVSCGLLCVLAVTVTIAQHDLAWILRTFSSLSTDVMLVALYTLELFPTTIRGTGLGATYFCGKFGATLSPLLVELSERTRQRPFWWFSPQRHSRGSWLISCQRQNTKFFLTYLKP